MTPFERLGGEPAVMALLDGLYTRGLADPLLAPFLENIDIARLKAHQFAFISQALGGPHQYSVPSLAAAHARLPIEQRHFDAFIAHLRSTLQEMGVAADLVAEIMAQVAPLSGVIVNTRSGAVQ
jgi:hemoglobin